MYHPNVHIRIFRKHWSLILGCLFPVSTVNSRKSVVFLTSFEIRRAQVLLGRKAKLINRFFYKKTFGAVTLIILSAVKVRCY